MPLESSFDHIDDLNPLWPDIDDPVSEGAAHIAGIKNALQANVGGSASVVTLRTSGGRDVFQSTSNGASLKASGTTLNMSFLDTNDLKRFEIGSGGTTAFWGQHDLPEFNIQLDDVKRLIIGGTQITLRTHPTDTEFGLILSQNQMVFKRNENGTVQFSMQDAAGNLQTIVAAPQGPTVFNHREATRGYTFQAGAINQLVLAPAGHTASINGVRVFAVNNGSLGLFGTPTAASPIIQLYDEASVRRVYMQHSEPHFSIVNEAEGLFRLWSTSPGGGTLISVAMNLTGDNEAMLLANGVNKIGSIADNQGFGSGAQVQDAGGVYRPVGFNAMAYVAITGNTTLTTAHAGHLMFNTSAVNHTITLPTAGLHAGATFVLAVVSNTGGYTIESAGTLQWLSGGSVVNGNRQMAGGSVATAYWTGGSWFIWGNGIA